MSRDKTLGIICAFLSAFPAQSYLYNQIGIRDSIMGAHTNSWVHVLPWLGGALVFLIVSTVCRRVSWVLALVAGLLLHLAFWFSIENILAQGVGTIIVAREARPKNIELFEAQLGFPISIRGTEGKTIIQFHDVPGVREKLMEALRRESPL